VSRRSLRSDELDLAVKGASTAVPIAPLSRTDPSVPVPRRSGRSSISRDRTCRSAGRVRDTESARRFCVVVHESSPFQRSRPAAQPGRFCGVVSGITATLQVLLSKPWRSCDGRCHRGRAGNIQRLWWTSRDIGCRSPRRCPSPTPIANAGRVTRRALGGGIGRTRLQLAIRTNRNMLIRQIGLGEAFLMRTPVRVNNRVRSPGSAVSARFESRTSAPLGGIVNGPNASGIDVFCHQGCDLATPQFARFRSGPIKDRHSSFGWMHAAATDPKPASQSFQRPDSRLESRRFPGLSQYLFLQ
jgi:hypothetical protein